MQRAREIWHHPVTFYAVFGALTAFSFYAGGWKMAVPPLGFAVGWWLLSLLRRS
ncbi:MAG TPA: hypothetical protein VFJ66_04495 [Gaiellales bacterium]|nr:hypothetical protein [Gaiellales bacterium]